MTTATYPDIRPALIGKSRSMAAGYVVSDGFPRIERLSFDEPITWSIRLIFKGADAVTFADWLDANGFRWFDMPLKTEQDFITHRVHFTDRGYPQLTGHTGDVFTYSAEIVSRAIQRIYTADEIDEIHSLFTEWDVRSLDYAVNRDWPEV